MALHDLLQLELEADEDQARKIEEKVAEVISDTAVRREVYTIASDSPMADELSMLEVHQVLDALRKVIREEEIDV